jgi:hypothetical protein
MANITTQELEAMLTKLAEEFGLSVKEYVEKSISSKPPDVEPANQKFKDTLGLQK